MSSTLVLGGLFTLLLDKELPAFQSPGTLCFAVRGKNGDENSLFALVCERTIPVRLNILQKVITVEDPAFLRLIHSGIAVWPKDGTERVVMIFERPAGQRLMMAEQLTAKPVPFDVLSTKLITPVVRVLEMLASKGVYHGAVRPDNIFSTPNMAGGAVLGECISAPPGYYQPILFETIQRGLTQPSGRGFGTISDDFYAFGVTLLTLVLGRSPLPDKSPEQILELKMDKGSFYALVHHNRVPTGLLEPLRGLLNDDPQLRWTIEDFQLWLGGRRLSPRPPEPPKRSVRPFDFNGQEIWTARSLSLALSKDTAAAHKLIENGEVESWMRRALGEKNYTEMLVSEFAHSNATGRGPRDVDITFARCSMAISPDSPVRYKGVTVLPAGVGSALAESMFKQQNTALIAQIIGNSLCNHWTGLFVRRKIPSPAPTVDLDHAKSTMERQSFGYGIERVLYELDPTAPCLSPMLDKHYVLTAADLVRALEQVAPEKMRDHEPIDRHVAAFMMVRFKRLEDWLLKALGDREDPGKAAMAQISIIANLQDKMNQPVLPNLARWAAMLGQSVIDRLHNRFIREKLSKQIEDCVKAGSVTGIAAVLDNPALNSQDTAGYHAAQMRYNRIADEMSELQDMLGNPQRFMKGYGRQLASVTAGILGSISLFVIVGWYALKG